MRTNNKKILSILLTIIILTCIGINVYAHSGRTDSNGGHKDNKNKSGLGTYHYHCGGYPAHLHTNGVCPYTTSSSSKNSTSSSILPETSSKTNSATSEESNKSTKSSSSSSKTTTNNTTTSITSSNTKTETTIPATIEVTGIEINESIQEMEIGESKKLTATITPNNATNKDIEWKSSDESIVTISENGEITAKKSGIAKVTVSSSNGKTNTIKITVNEEEKIDISNTIATATIISSNINNDTIDNNFTSSDAIGEIATVGLLGGGSYLGYKKYKNSKR